MAPIEICVTGTSSIHRHPERAFLTLRVSSSGTSQETVSEETTSRSNDIQQLLKDLAPKTETGEPTPDAPVTIFSVGFLKSWSSIPYSRDDEPRARVYRAQVNINANFRDFNKLGEVTAKLLRLQNVEISGIDWQLTKPTRIALGSESRKLAMLDAVAKARDYTEVIGREVVATHISDNSSTNFHPRSGMVMPQMPQQLPQMMQQMPGGYGRGETDGGLDVTPHNIDVTHSVQVTFRGE